MAISKDGSSNPKTIVYSTGGNSHFPNKVNYNGTIVWARPYTLSVTNNYGTITRNSTLEPSATTGSLSNGDTVYYGDSITITCNQNTSQYAYSCTITAGLNTYTLTNGQSRTFTSVDFIATSISVVYSQSSLAEMTYKWTYKTTDSTASMVISVSTKDEITFEHRTLDGALINTYTLPAIETETAQTITLTPQSEITQIWTMYDYDSTLAITNIVPNLTFTTQCDVFSCTKWGNYFYWSYTGGNSGSTQTSYIDIPYNLKLNNSGYIPQIPQFVKGNSTSLSWKDATANTPPDLNCTSGNASYLSGASSVTTSNGLLINSNVVVGSVSSVNQIVVPSTAYNLPQYLIQHAITSFTMNDSSTIKLLPQNCITNASAGATFTLAPSIREIGGQALGVSVANCVATFKTPKNAYVQTPAQSSSSGIAYNKTSRAWTIKSNNPSILTFGWTGDNITPTYQNLNGASFDSDASGTATFSGKTLTITSNVDSIMAGYNDDTSVFTGTVREYKEFTQSLVVGANDLSSFIDSEITSTRTKIYFRIILYSSTSDTTMPMQILVTYDAGA